MNKEFDFNDYLPPIEINQQTYQELIVKNSVYQESMFNKIERQLSDHYVSRDLVGVNRKIDRYEYLYDLSASRLEFDELNSAVKRAIDRILLLNGFDSVRYSLYKSTQVPAPKSPNSFLSDKNSNSVEDPSDMFELTPDLFEDIPDKYFLKITVFNEAFKYFELPKSFPFSFSKKKLEGCFFALENGLPMFISNDRLRVLACLGDNFDQVINSLKCLFTQLLTNYGSDRLNFILFDKSGEFGALEKVKQNMVGKIIDDYSILPAVIQFIFEESERRRQLFEEQDVTCFVSYNRKVEKPLPEIVIAFSDFLNVYDYFGPYGRMIATQLSLAYQRSINKGLKLFFFSSTSDKHETFTNGLRCLAGCKVYYKMNKGNYFPTAYPLKDANELKQGPFALMKYFNDVNTVYPYYIDNERFNNQFKQLELTNLDEQNAFYEKLKDCSTKGQYSKEEREKSYYQRIMIETMYLAFTYKKIAPYYLENFFDYKLCDAVALFEVMCQKGYLKKYDVLDYRPLITRAQFKKIFGEGL